MKANTAVCLTLSGLALLLCSRQTAVPRTLWIARACAAFVVLASLVTLSQYIIGQDLGIDQLLFHDSVKATGTYSPGRMAPNTAFNFILDGIAMLLLLSRSPRTYRWAQLLGVVTGLIGLLAFIGYAYDVRSFLGLGFYTQMALNTALAFILLSA